MIDSTSTAFEAVLSVNANNASQFDGRLQPAGIGTSTPLTGGPFSGKLILLAIFDRTGAAEAQVFIADTVRGTMAYTAALAAPRPSLPGAFGAIRAKWNDLNHIDRPLRSVPREGR